MKNFITSLVLSLLLSLTAFGQSVSGGGSSLKPATVTVKRCNLTNVTTALSDPAAATVRATVIKH